MNRDKLEIQLQNLEQQGIGYVNATLRLVLSLALGTAIFALAGICIFVNSTYSWVSVPAGFIGYFVVMMFVEFKRDYQGVREIEETRQFAIVNLREQLAQLELDELDSHEPSEETLLRHGYAQRQKVWVSGENPNHFKVSHEETVLADDHPALADLSPEHPDPRTYWGQATMRELYDIMVRDWENKTVSDYAFVYGIVKGLAQSGPAWYDHAGLTPRNFTSRYKLLAEAGIVNDKSQGDKTTKVFIKNPVQAYLVAYLKYVVNA